MTAMLPFITEPAHTSAETSRSVPPPRLNSAFVIQFLVIVSILTTAIPMLTGCSKTAKRPEASNGTTTTALQDSAPPPELALYHAFSGWIDAFNSQDADILYHRCTRSSLIRLRTRFAVHDVHTFDSLFSTLTDSLVFPFGARIVDPEVLDLSIRGSSGNITALYRLLWKDMNEQETGIFTMKRENSKWNVEFVSPSLSFHKGWWRRFGKDLESLEDTGELVFNEPASRVTFRYPRNWHVSFPVPVKYPPGEAEQPSIVLDVPGTEEAPDCKLTITVIDSLLAIPDPVASKHDGVTVFGPGEINLPNDRTGLEWVVEHTGSGRWIRAIAVSDSGPGFIQSHRKSIEKLLSTMNIITYRK